MAYPTHLLTEFVKHAQKKKIKLDQFNFWFYFKDWYKERKGDK